MSLTAVASEAGSAGPVPPDDDGAALVACEFSRIAGQRIVFADDGDQCTVLGMVHRRSVERRITLPVAMGLARRGVRTVVRVQER